MSIVEFQVRSMSTEDVGEVLAVQRAAFQIEAKLYRDPLLPPLVETAAEITAELADSLGFVACLGDRLAGSIRVRVDGRQLHIGRLAVAPDLQGRGIGRALLARAENAAPADEALLFTGHLSAGNLGLYAGVGYVETRRKKFNDQVTLVYLHKLLG